MGKQSLRGIAKELDISPAYLSYMVNGKRPWRKDLYQRYMGVVNTFVNSGPESVNRTTNGAHEKTANLSVKNTVVELERLELSTSSMPLKRSPG